MFSPQWIHTFLAIAESGSFTRAAEHLGLTQAAVSQHVRQLEMQLGPLLLRRPRALELTPAGLAFLDYCREVEQASRRLQVRLADAEAFSGEVGLTTPGSVGLALHGPLLALQAAHPGLVIRHRFAPDTEILAALLEKQYDFGVVTLRPDDPRFAASEFAAEVLELVVPAGVAVEQWEDLVRLGFIEHPDGPAMATRLLSRAFPANPGVRSLPRHGYINQVSLILDAVAQGFGFTVIPRHARQAYAQPAAISVALSGEAYPLWLVQRAEWPLSARASFVLEQLRAAMREA
ncbi:LysR family transcriptional regulator [Uliginosibacterium aquaticum]|uniref:LysR family transcriptional regulator n=1 Tax=Uliginosibacterium aquaticum TaxID=2731212 RepID=A0ABX2IG59_9RHOO|nr:LysR family transcriptional regulator [Uliginosibacterium aquaticum]NSL55698.1 LysR family transcriptional regulator [Uliginosibacterium aquaticum]